MIIGTTLKIQIEGAQSRLTSELMGVEEVKHLFIKMPPLQSMGDVTRVLYNGKTIIIRYLHRGTVFSFKSCISHVIHYPVKIVVLKYPEKIENHNLRAHKRIDCYLPANVKVSDSTIGVTIADISRGGCQVTVKKLKIENSTGLLGVDNEIGVSFQLPGVEKILTATGKEKYIKEDTDSVNIGVEFNNMDNETQERLFDLLSAAGA
jgi:c-di-GMP-binding flagellar brake protein YcgR